MVLQETIVVFVLAVVSQVFDLERRVTLTAEFKFGAFGTNDGHFWLKNSTCVG